MSAVAAAIAGGLISSAGQIYANQQTLQNNNERFGDQINLANTAHQREVQDLLAAGLNPILSASGSGAAVPQLGSPEVGNPTRSLGDSIQSAGRLAALEIPLKESQVEVNSAQAENLKADGVLKRAWADSINSARDAVDSLGEPSKDFGDWFGQKWNDIFGPKPVTPVMTRRAIDSRLKKDELEAMKYEQQHRDMGMPNRVRTPKRRKK